jgi:hypothetical protein
MLKNVILAALLLAGATAQAQESPLPYVFAGDIADTLRAHPERNQQAAWEYSQIGRYQAALEAWGKSYGGAVLSPLSRQDTLAFAAYRPTEARAYILERARHERIIIINEAHHVPRHRVFTASLLPALAAQGYRYLAVEGLDGSDSLLTRRGYPTRASGYYVNEPCYGNMLRTALKAGMQVRPYDYGYPEGDPANRIRNRELGQVRNIQRLLAADPQAKIIIHCGFGHLSERPSPEGDKWMAAYLKELTGIDPFTLDQTVLTEAATLASSNRYYRPQLGPQSAVLLNAQRQPFSANPERLSADASLYHPPTRLVQGRPDWLFTEGRQPVAVASKIKAPYPCQVLAYVAGEPAEAVPADVIELASKADATALALAPGRYRVVVRSHSGPVQEFELKR